MKTAPFSVSRARALGVKGGGFEAKEGGGGGLSTAHSLEKRGRSRLQRNRGFAVKERK